jgi:hypothetical protein
MIDSEKVIKGLECCIKHDPDDKMRCGECPYEGACLNRLKADALALLKAQEPRVMTLDEVVTAKPGTVVWLEDFDKPDVISGLLKRLFICTKVIDFLTVKKEVNNEVTADLDVYGSEWRCWSAKPTDAQREAAPWEVGKP